MRLDVATACNAFNEQSYGAKEHKPKASSMDYILWPHESNHSEIGTPDILQSARSAPPISLAVPQESSTDDSARNFKTMASIRGARNRVPKKQSEDARGRTPPQNVTAPRAKRQRGAVGLVAMLCIAASIHSANECGQFSSRTPINTGLNTRQLEETSREEVIVDSSPALTKPYTMHFLGLVRELSPHFLHHCLIYRA